jgi:hypothetical protein
MQKILLPVLAVIMLTALACTAAGDTDLGSDATSEDPAATLEAVSQTLNELDLASLDGFDIDGLMQELLASPELMECLTASMDLSSLTEAAESEPTAADIDLILPCFSGDQLEALTSATLPGFDLSALEDIDLDTLIQELAISPELKECLSRSLDLSSLMELAERESTEADTELVLSCFSEEDLAALSSAGLELGSFEDFDLDGLTQELEISPKLTECLTGSMDLSSLLGLVEREPTDAETELVLSCLSDEELDSITSATIPELDLSAVEDLDLDGLMEELMSSPVLAECSASSLDLASLMELAQSDPTTADIESALPCLSDGGLESLLDGR